MKTLGYFAFEAYTAYRGGKNHDGTPTPGWMDLGSDIRAAWDVAAQAAAAAASGIQEVDLDRRLCELGPECFKASVQRGTGRTTRVLKHAAALARAGRTVKVIMEHPAYGEAILGELDLAAEVLARLLVVSTKRDLSGIATDDVLTDHPQP